MNIKFQRAWIDSSACRSARCSPGWRALAGSPAQCGPGQDAGHSAFGDGQPGASPADVPAPETAVSGCVHYALVFRQNREVLDLLDVVPRENVLVLDDRSLMSLSGMLSKCCAPCARSGWTQSLTASCLRASAASSRIFRALRCAWAFTGTLRKGFTGDLLSTGRCCTTRIGISPSSF